MLIDYHILAIVAGFIILDIVSGFSQAIANNTISSIKMRQGLWHKSAYILAIALAILCEYSSAYIDLNFTIPITNPICIFICLTELVSIIENLGKLNPDILPGLQKFFAQNKNRRIDDN